MDVFEAIMQRRSERAYLPREVERELLDRLVDAARWAPTGGNAQAWRFIIVDDKKSVVKLKSVSPGMFHEPTFIIAICADRTEAKARMGSQGETLALMDLCMAAQNILLAAHALGLGACVIRSFHQQAAAKLLGCPEGVVPELLISGGYPQKKSPTPPRRGLEEIRYFNRWDNQ